MDNAPDELAINFRPFVMAAFPAEYLRFILNSTELVASDRAILSVIMEWKLLHPNAPGMELDKLLQHARYDVLTPKERMVFELKGGCKLTSARLLRNVEKNRRSMGYLQMLCTLPQDFEPLHRICVPDFQHRGLGERDGMFVMNMRLDQGFIESWRGEMVLQRRFMTSVGPYASSVYLSSYQGSLICSVTLDRRLSGDAGKSLASVLQEYEVYATILCKTDHIEWGDLETRVRCKAVDSIPKQHGSQALEAWQTVSSARRILIQSHAGELLQRANADTVSLDIFVDVSVGRSKAQAP